MPPTPDPVAECMAPGHVYDPATGTGLAWEPERVHLWEAGRVTATAPHATASPGAFWYTLGFADTFPQVTHWWFGSPWTGRIWLWPTAVSADEQTATGRLQFVDRATPPLPWQITRGRPVQVAVPLPPFAVHAINLPLRSVLAQYVLALYSGDIRAAPPPPDEEAAGGGGDLDTLPGTYWVTSLVARRDLAAAFPPTRGVWRLEQVDLPLRAALCTLQGLALPSDVAW